MDTSNGTAYMAATHPRYKNLSERSEHLNGRLNTLRQQYAMHEATHAEYGIIRARNLQRALQTLKNRSKACEARNKSFLKEFEAMEERAAHVDSVSFAKRALERSTADFSRVATARRPAWQQQAMRNKEKRMKELEKEKQKMEAQRIRSAELFKHERELNATLAKKREETLALQAKLRREELERQLQLEKSQQQEDVGRREREMAIASENDKLRIQLQALANKREEEKRQHELTLAAMREAEHRAIATASSRRLDMPPPAPVVLAKALPAARESPARSQPNPSPAVPDTPQPRSPKKQADSSFRGTVASPERAPEPAAAPPPRANPKDRDENEEITRRMQDRLEAEQVTRQMRREISRDEEREASSYMNISTATSDKNESSVFLDRSSRAESLEEDAPNTDSWSWEDWVETADLLVEHIQKSQNRPDLQFGYGDPDRAWGHLFLQTSGNERKKVLGKVHSAAMERMGGKARREVISLGMLQWCTGFCELLRCVAEGMVGSDLVREKIDSKSVLGLVDINRAHAARRDGRDEVWRTIVAHFTFLRDECKLAPTYLARTFGLYLTPQEANPGFSSSVKRDKLVAGLLLEILAPKPELSPPKPKPAPKPASPVPAAAALTPKSEKRSTDSLNRSALKNNSIAAPSPMSMFMQPKASSSKKALQPMSKPKIGVLDKVRKGYSFGEDDFDDEEEALLTDLTRGSTTFGSSKVVTQPSASANTPVILGKNPPSIEDSSVNMGQISEVIELESYEDSFDDDF